MELFEKEIYQRYMSLIGAVNCCSEPRSVRIDDLIELYDVFCFDGYGTLYNRGNFVYPGSIEMFCKLRTAGKQMRLVTNAASDVEEVLASAAAKRGFEFSPTETISSGSLLAGLTEKLRGGPAPRKLREVFYIGRETGKNVLHACGIEAVENPMEPVVAISSAKETAQTYAKAVEILRKPGAVLLVLNSDAWAPKIKGDREPVSGALSERLRRDSVCERNFGEGCETYYLGKPFPAIWDAVRKSLPASLFDERKPRVLMVGDTLGTDVYGAKMAGFDAALIVGRNEPAAELAEDEIALGVRPDWYLLP
ncbi:MAG: HAD hydrolase-like protein [Fibrobacter sp.]|nr:HAD hydrolase-like protein [Fibrobacter sp.]